MKRRSTGGGGGAGSLDMLLDTMCNTFGGVCFIALLVAILSAMLPKDSGAAEEDVRKLAEDERLSQLVRTRDDLKVALETQRDILAQYGTNGLSTVTAADIAKSMKDKAAEIKRLAARRIELEEEIKKLATDDQYNRKEFERLKKLEEELKRKIADFKDARKRVVRTPVEREEFGWDPWDFWIRDGRLRERFNTSQVSCREVGFGQNSESHYTCIPGTGWRLTDDFLSGSDYASVLRRIPGGKTYVRIFVDRQSFAEACRLRDDLIRRNIRYNWYWTDNDELVFIFGSDSKIQ